MNSGPEYEQAKKELHEKLNEVYNSGFMALRHSASLKEDQLKHTGYKSMPEAVVGTYQYYQKKADNLLEDFFRKWPD